MLLEGKNALITGSNRGIGKAILETFAKEGCETIWAHARNESAEFVEYIADISKRYDLEIIPVYFDLSDEESLKKEISGIVKSKKTIDILVNNAGIPAAGTLHTTTQDYLKHIYQVNYFSQILIMQLITKAMIRKKSGSVVNIASVGGIETRPGYLAYGSSKAALIWATKSLSKELGNYNIRVNAVAPGLTETRMGHYKSESELIDVLEHVSLKRMATPEEIAKAVLFLASDMATFVTGHVLVADGGRIL